MLLCNTDVRPVVILNQLKVPHHNNSRNYESWVLSKHKLLFWKMNGFQESFEVEYWSNYSHTRSLPVFFLFLSAEFETLCRSKNNTFLNINMVNVDYANNNLNLGKKTIPVTFGAEATYRFVCTTTYMWPRNRTCTVTSAPTVIDSVFMPRFRIIFERQCGILPDKMGKDSTDTL